MGSKGTHIGKYVADRFTGHIGQGSTAHLLGKKISLYRAAMDIVVDSYPYTII